MNKKRMSDRKSELRLNIQDFCLSLPQNSDPIVGYLLTILEWQASLDVQTNSILHKSFVNQIQQLKCKLRMQLKHLKSKNNSGVSTPNANSTPNIIQNQKGANNKQINKLINQFHILKQIFSYCLILCKKNSQLYGELEKFNQYKLREPKLTQQLENYLNQPIIFQTIFHSYLRVYNVNILTADLIRFLYAEHQEKLIDHTQNGYKQFDQQIDKWSNPDIELLKNHTIIFKELSDMNKKYIQLEYKLKSSYIYYLCNEGLDNTDSCQSSTEFKGQQQVILKQKIKSLEILLSKIKKQPGLYQVQKSSIIIKQVEPLSNFSAIELFHDFPGWKVIQTNKQFFLQTLYGKLWTETIIGDEQFTFMREKIIKIEALFYLNRTLAATNVISFIYNQLDLEVKQAHQIQFKNLRKLIGSQFINKETYQSKVTQMVSKQAFISHEQDSSSSLEPCPKSYIVFDSQNNKIIYPSAIHYLFCFVKNMMAIDFSNLSNGKDRDKDRDREYLMQILKSKSEYMESLAQTIVNIFQIVKNKHFSCYRLLRDYIETILKSSCWNGLGYYQNCQQIVKAVSRQKDKIGIISQIIYEFDHNYSIKQPLEQLIRIQFDGLTKNCISTFQLYKSILFQIIQIRNGLKLDHYYSVNQIHEIFSLIPPDFEKADEEKKSKHQDLYFQDIIHQICIASHHNLYLPKLFFFFDLQLKFKRIVFKLELCWSCNRQSMFERKAQSFKQFINTYCAPIFEIVKQCHSIVQILEKIQQIERYIQIFSKQVSRFYLIQKLVSIINLYKKNIQINCLRQHINRLSLENLQQINTILNIFNPIQSQKGSHKLKFIESILKSISTFSSIRVSEIKNFNPTYIKQRERLASITVLLHMIRIRNEYKDHECLIKMHNQITQSFDLYQQKQNQIMMGRYELFLNCQNIEQLINYFQDLFAISILKTLREMEDNASIVSQDYIQLKKLMTKFQLSKTFTNICSIQQIQFWRNELGIMTKYHQIYQLMFQFDYFNSKVYGNFGKKAQYKDKKLLNQLNHTMDFNYQKSDFITKLYYIFQITPLAKMKLLKNLQKLQQEILQTQSIYKKSQYYHLKLKKKIYFIFCQQLQKILNKYEINEQIDIQFNGKSQPSEYIDCLRKKMLKDVSTQYKYHSKQDGYGEFQEIQMFRQKKGYQLPIIQPKQPRDYKIATKKHLQRPKKPIISPHKLQQQKTKPLQSLRRKFKIQFLKKSLQIRKHISKLQLNENKIRQQIVWQTSKLQHSVVQKINQFISLSNVDQQQSYINFKHTVNLETMKGIENVIEEQTEMYMEKKNRVIEDKENEAAFLTAIDDQQNQQQKLDNKNKLLDANVQSILKHMKKIKIFSAWKKTMKKADLTKKQWCNFNLNVQNILNNDKIVHSLNQIQDARNNYLKQNVTCQIMKQQNKKINEKIQQLKIKNLEKKVLSYRERLMKQ